MSTKRGRKKEEKDENLDTWTIRNVPTSVRTTIVTDAKKISYSIAEYLTYLVETQKTSIANIDPEALTGARMMASRLNMSVSQFVSNAILKEVKDVVKGKNNHPVAVISPEDIMTVDKVETLIKDLKTEMFEMIKEIKKEPSAPKEKFFRKLKEKIFKQL